jgi:hypothetical protein
MKRKIKNKILLWFRMGTIPAMIFSALNAVGITTLTAPRYDAGADVEVSSSIAAPPSSDAIKTAPISEVIIEPAPKQKTDISYLQTGTSVVAYMRTDTPISVILPDGTVRKLPKQK